MGNGHARAVSFVGCDQHQREGNPPNDIVGDDRRAPGPWEFATRCRFEKADRTEYLAEKSNENDGPVPNRIIAGDPISDAVHTDNHPDALPNLGIKWVLHASPSKELQRRRDYERTPGQIVNSSQP